ncbi:hypothetical protein M9458_028874, partial [Cirrhinus mrigala]
VVDGGRAEEECETTDRKRNLQDLLRQEMDLHLTGKHEETHISLSHEDDDDDDDDDSDDDGDDDVRGQGQVNRITQLKEEIRLQQTHRDSSQSHATSTVSDQSGDTVEKLNPLLTPDNS